MRQTTGTKYVVTATLPSRFVGGESSRRSLTFGFRPTPQEFSDYARVHGFGASTDTNVWSDATIERVETITITERYPETFSDAVSK